MEERTKKINEFLKAWNCMLDKANEIEGFKWRFEVSITSDNSLVPDRVQTIIGINESFTKHEMSWSSSNN